MTITHIVDCLEVGGSEMLVVSLCQLQQQWGHAPSVHCLFGGGSLVERLQQQGIPVFLHQPRPRWQLLRGLLRDLRRAPPDVVHCHNATATLLGAPMARLAGAGAVVSTRHGMGVADYPWKGEMRYWMAARCCDRVVAVSETSDRNLKKMFGSTRSKIVLLRNGAASALASPPLDGPVHKEGFVLVHVARLMWKKDQSTLLHAVALARQRAPEVRLWIIGDGPDQPALESLAAQLGIADRVHFFGQRPNVGYWLARADLFVLSSVSEGTPVALLEAMAEGLPFIVTDVGGMPEVARLGGGGTVVPAAQPEAMAAAIVHHARRREELPALRAAVRETYQKYLTLDRMTKDYVELYEDVLRSRRPAGTEEPKQVRSTR